MKRHEQNKALTEFITLELKIKELKPLVPKVLARGLHSSGRLQQTCEHGISLNRPCKNCGATREDNRPNDPTGELAIHDEMSDSVATEILSLARHISFALNIANHVLSIVADEDEEKPEREVICRACQLPIVGRVISEYDEGCYKRWTRRGKPDRAAFEQARLLEVSKKVSTGQ